MVKYCTFFWVPFVINLHIIHKTVLSLVIIFWKNIVFVFLLLCTRSFVSCATHYVISSSVRLHELLPYEYAWVAAIWICCQSWRSGSRNGEPNSDETWTNSTTRWIPARWTRSSTSKRSAIATVCSSFALQSQLPPLFPENLETWISWRGII